MGTFFITNAESLRVHFRIISDVTSWEILFDGAQHLSVNRGAFAASTNNNDVCFTTDEICALSNG